MKFSLSTVIALLGATTTVLAGATINSAYIDECGGANNVMPVPEGANATEYRHCLNHPLGQKAGPSQLESLEKRSCWYGKDVGCTNNYCWKRCGDNLDNGFWCWTAADGGTGPWYQCTSDSQCNASMNCGAGDCDSCGCSC